MEFMQKNRKKVVLAQTANLILAKIIYKLIVYNKCNEGYSSCLSLTLLFFFISLFFFPCNIL